jgi:PPP family 3-phenylpropionic acid transporter
VPSLIVLQPLHALSFAATHLGAVQYLARAVPAQRAATAQSLYAAVVNGLGLGLVALGAGALYEAIGGGAYFAMAAMGAAGALLAARLARSARYLASMTSE